MQLLGVKIIVVMIMVGISMSAANAQLLQDRNKLKTEKRKSRGFSFFRKQVRTSSGRPQIINLGSPRYSKGSSGKQTFRIAPRYSQSIAGKGGQRTVIPRYSKVIAGQGGDRSVSPRFSKDPGNFGSFVIRSPRTASDRSFVFSFPRVEYYINRKKNRGEDAWNFPKSPGKIKKEGRDFHPSTNYLTAKYKTNKLIREGLQKFNLLWTRVNGNKTEPKGVYKKSKKLKFDKDETEIWNNKEREYSHN